MLSENSQSPTAVFTQVFGELAPSTELLYSLNCFNCFKLSNLEKKLKTAFSFFFRYLPWQ